MCGRYILENPLAGSDDDPPGIDSRFLAELLETDWLTPRYNVAPTNEMPVITNEGRRRVERMRWGLVPFWAKDIKIGSRHINARGETVAERPAFRRSFTTRRCLVPATGFYEWRREGKARTPMLIRLRGGGFFAMAGLYDRWKSPEGEWIGSFTVITTEANNLVASIHDRMPVILPEEAEAAWVNLEIDSAETLKSFIAPFPAASMESFEVSTAVNSVRNDGPELIEPVEGARLAGM